MRKNKKQEGKMWKYIKNKEVVEQISESFQKLKTSGIEEKWKGMEPKTEANCQAKKKYKATRKWKNTALEETVNCRAKRNWKQVGKIWKYKLG